MIYREIWTLVYLITDRFLFSHDGSGILPWITPIFKDITFHMPVWQLFGLIMHWKTHYDVSRGMLMEGAKHDVMASWNKYCLVYCYVVSEVKQYMCCCDISSRVWMMFGAYMYQLATSPINTKINSCGGINSSPHQSIYHCLFICRCGNQTTGIYSLALCHGRILMLSKYINAVLPF